MMNLYKYLFFALLLIVGIRTNAQVINFSTTPTPYTTNNSSGGIGFVIQNTNPFPAILNSVGNFFTSAATPTVELWASATNISGAPGVISAANGWTLVSTNTPTVAGGGVATLFSGLSYSIPGGATVRFHISSNGTIQYNCISSGVACNTINSFANTGVNLLCGSYTINGGFVGFGGNAAGATFNPRYFVGELSLTLLSAPCTGTPVAGTATVSSTNPCAGTAIQLGLTGSTAASALSYQWFRSATPNGPWLPLPGASNMFSNYTPPAGSSFYYRCVVTCTTSGLVDSSSVVGPVLVQAFNPCGTCYCTSNATAATNEDILNVTMGSLNNTTTCLTPLTGSQGTTTNGTPNQYADFTCTPGVQVPVLFKNVTQPFSVTIGTCGATSTNSAFKIYIDYNRNNSFSDPGEEVYFSGTTAITSLPSSTVGGSFTVPNAALTGLTRMRIVSRNGGQATATTIVPCGTYTSGETEDYVVNIVQPSQYDPAVASIVLPSGTCPTNCETVTVNVANYGSSSINCFNNPITVNLIVNGPNGPTTYTSILNQIGQTLNPYAANTLTVTFPCVNLYDGGTYSINTTLSIGTAGGVNNPNLWNDSISPAPTLINYRPTAGPDYQLCQFGSIPFGQGLTASGCAVPLNDSIVINFTIAPTTNPTANNILGSRLFATGTIPSNPLPSGLTVTSAYYRVTNLSTQAGGWANETRFPIFAGNIPPVFSSNILYTSAVGNPSTSSANYTWNNIPSLTVPSTNGTYFPNLLNYITNPTNFGGTLSMGYHSTWSGNGTSNGFAINAQGNTSVAKLVIYYQYVPASFEWYEVPVGGNSIYNSVPLNPLTVTNNVVSNSNTPGVYPFYVACAGNSACRDSINLVINPSPTINQDTIYKCEFPVGSNGATFDLTQASSSIAGNQVGASVSFWQDQGLFLPLVPDTAWLSSTNFVYASVTSLNNCVISDSVYLVVQQAPNLIPYVTGNACYPNCINTSSLIVNSGIIPLGSSTNYFMDPNFSIQHPNPLCINSTDTVYAIVTTNTNPGCSDTIEAYIDVQGAGNYIANQVIPGNYSTCGPVGTNIITLSDGMSDTARTSTDCMKVASVYDVPDGTNLGAISVYEEVMCPTPIHNGQPYLNRWYEFTPTNNDSAYVCLFYLDEDINSFNNDVLSYNAANNTNWPLLNPSTNMAITKVSGGVLGSGSSTTVTIPTSLVTSTYDANTTVWTVCFPVDGFSSFYGHTLNGFNAPLPVTLLSFEGKRVDSKSVLSWLTATEQNNSHFVVERSKDSRTFNAISDQIPSKAAHGNSSTALSYGYTDTYPAQGHNYYRLQQVDIDGNKSYSKVVDVYYNDETMITLYPNPAEDVVNLDINVKQGTEVKAQLLDATGRIVKEESVRLVVGLNQHKMDISSLADGVYMLKLTNGRGINYTQTLRKK